MPQTSVESDVLMSLAEKVAKAALSRGIVGHISVDFVTFIHPDDVSYCLVYYSYYKYYYRCHRLYGELIWTLVPVIMFTCIVY